jgi:3-hydroxybutyryl-CoA dehydrogenase
MNILNKKTFYNLFSKFSFSSSIKKNIGVVGSGQMGTGIAYVFGRVAQHNVILYDTNSNQLAKSSKFMDNLLDKEIAKGTLNNDLKTNIKSNMKFTDNLQEFTNCSFIVEAATENFEVKEKIFKSLDEITGGKDVILATNTSSISITKIASKVSKPEKVIGMHFMNPVPVMKLVEVIRGLQTDDNTFNNTLEY